MAASQAPRERGRVEAEEGGKQNRSERAGQKTEGIVNIIYQLNRKLKIRISD